MQEPPKDKFIESIEKIEKWDMLQEHLDKWSENSQYPMHVFLENIALQQECVRLKLLLKSTNEPIKQELNQPKPCN